MMTIEVRRHRAPPHIAIRYTPTDPRWGPTASRNPDPTVTSEIDPTTIVIHDGAIVFGALKSPARISQDPLSILIGLPAFFTVRRHPDPSKVFGPHPGALAVQIIPERYCVVRIVGIVAFWAERLIINSLLGTCRFVGLDDVFITTPIVFRGRFHTVDLINPGLSTFHRPGIIHLRRGLWKTKNKRGQRE
jgi:hypothetical protein